jgi:hypothetical protein
VARARAEEELEKLTPSKPDSTRDIAHFAATVRGYETWGLPENQNDYGLGDLGGWALDLLQLWGFYLKAKKEDPTVDLTAYLRARLGVVGAGGGFGWDDVVADADAYLVSRAKAETHSTLSGAARGLLKLTAEQRVAKFNADRFGESADNVARAFASLVDNGTADLPPDLALKEFADAERLPTPDEARTCALVYAQLLQTQG